MTRVFWFFCAIFSLSLSPLAPAQDGAHISAEDRRLSKIHSQIIKDHPALTHVSAAEIDALIANEQDVLLLDVREAKEFSVSHIDGAIRVDPDISPSDFMTRFGDQAAGKTVILYCSVGRRSSKLGARVRQDLLDAGARHVSNLAGGVFRWHNDHGPLINSSGDTEKVHPYNVWWGRLLTRKDDLAYKADEEADR